MAQLSVPVVADTPDTLPGRRRAGTGDRLHTARAVPVAGDASDQRAGRARARRGVRGGVVRAIVPVPLAADARRGFDRLPARNLAGALRIEKDACGGRGADSLVPKD